MEIEVYLTFVLTTTVLILLPGPSVMLTVAHSLSFGVRAALMTVAGTTLAIVLQLLITALGMTSVLLVVAEWFDVLRWGGVLYLIYLGIGQWRAGGEAAKGDALAEVSPRSLFWHGFVVSATNPKSLFFYVAFFPQFIDAGADLAFQLSVLCLTFLVIAAVLTAGYAILAGQVRGWFQGSRECLRNRLAGTLLIGAGIGLALVRRS